MDSFTSPVSGGKIKSKMFSKEVEIKTSKNSKVKSPYSGVVDFVGSDEVKIKHNFNGNLIYTKFKKVTPISGLNVGERLSDGEHFANAADENIEFSIIDKNGKTLSVDSFFKESDKSFTGGKTTNKPALLQFYGDLLKYPFDMIGDINPLSKKAWTGKETQTESSKIIDKILDEEIKRIKNLLK